MPEALLGMPAVSSVNANWTMLRLGQDGLALLSSAMDYTTDQPTVMVMLRGPFIAPYITVAVPASDLANTGTASLVATNPGASGSNALMITIN